MKTWDFRARLKVSPRDAASSPPPIDTPWKTSCRKKLCAIFT
jgi:hypothetical protein